MAVALGDVRGSEAALLAHHFLALAGARDPEAVGGDNANETDSIANCTDCHLNSRVAHGARGCSGAGLGRFCGKGCWA